MSGGSDTGTQDAVSGCDLPHSGFSDYDAYFTLRGYQEMEQALEEDPVDGDWVGCILVKDNKFYFGSYENQITGICLQQLRKVLGGNAK